MIDISDFRDYMARIAEEVVGRSQFSGTLVVTSYNATNHTVKGIIQPHGIESGDVPIATPHASNNAGILSGPRVGSADKMDGTVFAIHFDGGDPDTLVATNRFFSSSDRPPRVESGEHVMQHESGTRFFLDKDGQLHAEHGSSGNSILMAKDDSISITHEKSGSSYKIDKDGNHIADTKGKSLSINASSIALTGNATLNGLPIKTG